MTLRLGVLHFVRTLSADRSERRRLGGAVVRLLRHRRRSLSALGPLLQVAPTSGKAKMQLWQILARSLASDCPKCTSSVQPKPLKMRLRVLD